MHSRTTDSAGVAAHDAHELARVPLVVHSHLRWDFVWQRPQQILSRLAARHPVLFVEEPVIEDGLPALRICEPHPNVVRVVPVLPPRHAGSVDPHAHVVLPLLRDAMATHPLLAGRFARPVQWFYTPMPAPAYIGALDEIGVVYDCMDELASFRFAPTDIARRERYLLAQADLVFTGGYQLYRSKARFHGNVHFYGCGVDVEHYRKARLPETAVPDELAALARPVLGYFGVIDERIDYELVDRLAQAFPEGSVAMVGPVVKVDPASLPSRPNLHWLGQRDYAALPAIVKGFDVCLMPFALNEATRHINPTKTLEYMAAAKPIVSTAVPDVLHHFAPIVRVAHSHEEFVESARHACAAPDPESIAEGLAMANAATWEAIVGAMRGHLVRTLAPPAQGAREPAAATARSSRAPATSSGLSAA